MDAEFDPTPEAVGVPHVSLTIAAEFTLSVAAL